MEEYSISIYNQILVDFCGLAEMVDLPFDKSHLPLQQGYEIIC